MNKIHQYLNVAMYGMIVVLFAMCNAGDLDFDGIKTPNLESDNTLPIGQTTYTILSLLDKLEDPNIDVTEDNSKLISIAYRDTTVFNDYLSIIELEDVSNPGRIEANSTPIFGSPVDQEVAIPTQDLSFEYNSPNNEELDSVKYSAGTITLDIESGYSVAVDYELTLTDIVNVTTGEAMVLSGRIPANGSHSDPEDLTGFKTIINFDRDTNTNLFSGQFDGILDVKTGDFIVGTEIITYTLTITNADFNEIYGWFGEKTIDIQSQSMAIDFFEDISENSLSFNNPQLNFYIENSFGVPMGLNLDAISASNASGNSIMLSGEATNSAQIVRAPSTTQVGQTESSVIRVDESNSNLRDLFSHSPNLFTVDVNAITNNNNANTSGVRNFVTQTSEVNVISELNLPLNVKLENVSRNFYTGIEGFEFDQADTIRLILTTLNQLPFEGTIDMQFLAADSTVLWDSRDVSFLQIDGIPVSGKIEEPVTTVDTVKISKGDGYEELLESSIVNIVTNFTSFEAADDNYVKLFSDYELILKLKVQANVNYEF